MPIESHFIVSFGEVYPTNIALTYVVHRHHKDAAQCVVVISAFKNLVAFFFLYEAVPWIDSQGYIQVYMIMFMVNMLALLFAVPLYIYGQRHKVAAVEPVRV